MEERTFGVQQRRFGLWCAAVTVLLSIAYIATIVPGLIALRSKDDPISDPFFTVMEVLIIVMMPPTVGLAVAVHSYAPTSRKVYSLLSVGFMTMLALVTCCVHFVVLTLSRHSAFSDLPSRALFLDFRWPSVVYALDVLAWDLFFPLAMFAAAAVFAGSRRERVIRSLLVLSGSIALVGIAGAFTGNMQLRNVGIVGYAIIWPVAAALIGVLFYRTSTSGYAATA